jgi:hypothetical protein
MRSIDPEDLAGANQAVFTAYLTCSTTGAAEFPDWIATVTWTGALPTDTITATGEPVRGSGPVSASGAGEAGSLTLQGNFNGIQNVAVSTSSGSSIFLGQCP